MQDIVIQCNLFFFIKITMKNSIIAQNKYMSHKCYDLILCVRNVGRDMIFPPTKQKIFIP